MTSFPARIKCLTAMLLAVVLCPFVSCKKNTSFTVEGTVSNATTLFIEELTPEGPLFLDSIAVNAKGHYDIKLEMPYPTFYYLHATENDFVVLRPEWGEKIVVDGDARNFQGSYRVSGSPESEFLWEFQVFTNQGIEEVMQLGQLDQQNRETYGAGTDAYNRAKAHTDTLFWNIYQAQRSYADSAIYANMGTLATLIVLNKQFVNDPKLPLVHPIREFPIYEDVLNGLQSQLPDNPHTQNFRNTVDRNRVVYERGGQIVDINLNE